MQSFMHMVTNVVGPSKFRLLMRGREKGGKYDVFSEIFIGELLSGF